MERDTRFTRLIPSLALGGAPDASRALAAPAAAHSPALALAQNYKTRQRLSALSGL